MQTKKPTYFEKMVNAKGDVSYLCVKRLNPKKGTYPLFSEKFKRSMAATNDAEATREALAIVAELEQLQEVARKDEKHVISTKDKNRAAETWLRLIANVDLQALKNLKNKKTKSALDANETLDFLVDEVTDFYKTSEFGHEGVINQWLTDFGDHLLKFLKDGQGVGSISEGVEIYLRQTQRDHLDAKDRSVQTVRRVAQCFCEIVGDKQLDQISRKDVEKYISTRLKAVKTTSVQREIRALSALWNRCADALDISIRSPFSNQPIHGLGTDSERRHTPSVDETKTVLALVDQRFKAAPNSYVWPQIAICALTGLRLSEAWGLLPEDWLKQDQVLIVRRNSKRKSLKTDNSVRPVPVLPPLAIWLERYLTITSQTGGAKSANSASASSLKALKTAGIKFGNHSLRHGMKDRLTEANATKTVIDELQGWSTQSMAANYGRNQATEAKKRYLAAVYQALGVLAPWEQPKSAQVINLRGSF